MGGRISARGVAAVLAATLSLAACTGGSDDRSASASPTPPVAGTPSDEVPGGLRVGVVLPPPGDAPITPAGGRLAADALRDEFADEVASVRVVAPDGPAFVVDVLGLLAGEHYDLVCAVGSGALSAVLAVARAFPGVHFCATPALGVELPENVLALDIDVTEAAYVAGIAVALVASVPPSPEGDEGPTAPAPQGMVIGTDQRAAESQTAAFRTAVMAELGAGVQPLIDAPVTSVEEATERAAAHYADGATALLSVAGPADAGVLEAAASADGLVVLYRDPAGWGAEGPGEQVLIWFELDVLPALRAAVIALLEGWQGGARSFGFAEDTIRAEAGGAPASRNVLGRVGATMDELRNGTLTVPTG